MSTQSRVDNSYSAIQAFPIWSVSEVATIRLKDLSRTCGGMANFLLERTRAWKAGARDGHQMRLAARARLPLIDL